MDHDVEASHGFLCFREALFDRLFIRAIAVHVVGFAAVAFRVGVVDDFLSGLIVDIDGENLRALAHKFVHDCRTDSSSTAGDDSLFAFKQVLSFEHCQTHDYSPLWLKVGFDGTCFISGKVLQGPLAQREGAGALPTGVQAQRVRKRWLHQVLPGRRQSQLFESLEVRHIGRTLLRLACCYCRTSGKRSYLFLRV